MPTFEYAFTEPHLLPAEDNTTRPPDPLSDPPDGYFTVPMVRLIEGVPFDYSGVTDDNSDGAPLSPKDGPYGLYASMNDEAFRLSFEEDDIPAIAVRARQALPEVVIGVPTPSPDDWPSLDQVATYTATFVIVTRALGSDNMRLQASWHSHPNDEDGYPAEDTTESASTPSPLTSEEWQTVELPFPVAYEPLRLFMGSYASLMSCSIFGFYPWGVHDVAYMGIRVDIELLAPMATTIQQTFARDDELAGGAFQTWPPPKSEQRSNRTFGGYR